MEDSKILEALTLVAPLIKGLVGLDMEVNVCDREKCLVACSADSYETGNFAGNHFDKTSPADSTLLKVMEDGKPKVDILPEFVYGVPVEGILTPIYENGEVVGIVSCAINISDRFRLKESAENLNTDLANTEANIMQVEAGATELSDKINSIKELSDGVKEVVSETTNIVKVIQSNSQKSNILALNASIEAARVGNAGSGFAVVASEMGKMAKVSTDSSKEITEKLDSVFSKINNILDNIEIIAEVAKGQVGTVEQMTTAIENVKSEANELEKAMKIQR